MPFDTPLSQDATIQRQGEYLELWETARYRQDHPQQQQQLNQDNNIHVFNNQNLNLDHAPMAPVQVEENPHHLGNPQQDHYNLQRAPTWLSTALSRQNPEDHGTEMERCPVCASRGLCICNATGGPSSAFLDQSAYTQWLGAGIGSSSQFQKEDGLQFGANQQQARMATELNLAAAHGRENAPQQGQGPFLEPQQQPGLGQQSGAGGEPGFAGEYSRADWGTAPQQEPDWEEVRRRCMVINHPRYPEMLAKHVDLLRVGTPVDQLPDIEAQLAREPIVTEKYRMLADQIGDVSPEEQQDLDDFMNDYPIMLGSLKELLQNHVYTDVTEAMMSCWELEQALVSLTGVRLEEGTGATMSDDDEDYDSDYGSYEQGMDFGDSGGFGPLVPTETERSLMERVRQELKHELKQGYKSKIEDVREEILRKRRAGKLPEGTTTVLKAWWQAHAKWPYPTEDEKELLIQETGLELKQVNNWFINQRKRNWHSNPLTNNSKNNNSAQASDSSKNKVRKSW